MTYATANFFYFFGQVFVITYASSFMTDILRYDAFKVATALTIGRAMDSLVSCFAGPILQHINPGRGKRDILLSWSILLRFLFFISLILMFCDTTFLGENGVWLTGLFYGIFSGIADLLQGTLYSMMGRMSIAQENLRNSMSIACSRGGKVAGIVFGLCTLPLLKLFTCLGSIQSYTMVAAIFGVGIFVGQYSFERSYVKQINDVVIKDESGEKTGFFDTCKSLFLNSSLRTILLTDVVYYAGMYAGTSLEVYYFKIMGRFDASYVLITTVINIASLLGVLVFPRLGIRLGKKRAKTVWMVVYGVLMIAFAFVGGRGVWVYGAVRVVTQSLFMMWNFFLPIYLVDASEAHLYETGIDTRIAAPATIQISNDLGSLLGGAITSYGLAFIGYEAINLNDLTTVTPIFLQKFLTIFAIAGILVLAAALVWHKYYHITDEDALRYAKENKKH